MMQRKIKIKKLKILGPTKTLKQIITILVRLIVHILTKTKRSNSLQIRKLKQKHLSNNKLDKIKWETLKIAKITKR